MIKIVENKNVDLSIYSDSESIKYLNENNRLTKSNLDYIMELMKKDYFIVPSKIVKQSWGAEKVFYPFSNKLFKVLSTHLGNTSLQLHPLKSEKYLSLSDKTIVLDESNEYDLKKFEFVDIKKNTIHCLKKDSKVFEEQDNNLFDSNETIRIYDSLGRSTNQPGEYYKYLLPQYKNNMFFDNCYENKYSLDCDKFIFIAEGKIIIEINNKEIILDKNEELYFISKNVKIKRILGKIRIIDCIYYGMEK